MALLMVSACSSKPKQQEVWRCVSGHEQPIMMAIAFECDTIAAFDTLTQKEWKWTRKAVQ